MTSLARVEDIPDPGSIAVTAEMTDGRPAALMLIRQGDEVFAYVNSCPHIGTPLDFTPGKFLTRDGGHILCSTHAAMFRIEDGFCVSGPCAGEGLEPVPVVVREGQVYLPDPV